MVIKDPGVGSILQIKIDQEKEYGRRIMTNMKFSIISPRGITRLKHEKVPGNCQTIGALRNFKYVLKKGAISGVPNSQLVVPALEDQSINITSGVVVVTDDFLNLIRQEFESSL